MTTDTHGTTGGSPSDRIDTTVPHPARRYNYWLGGKDNFQADRESGDAMAAAFPTIRTSALENRRFLQRAVGYLAREAGIRQFLDIGTGIPTANNTHEVAQAVAPESRVVYVDNDPIVLAHARALLTSSPEGATAYIDADLRDPEKILAHPELQRTIDLSQPVGLMLVAVLHFVPDGDDPYALVRRLLDALPAGQLPGRLARHPRIPPAGDRRGGQGRGQGRQPARADQPAHAGPSSPASSRGWTWSSRASPRSRSGGPRASRSRVRRSSRSACTAGSPACPEATDPGSGARGVVRSRAECTSPMCVSAHALMARCTGSRLSPSGVSRVVDPGRHARGHRPADRGRQRSSFASSGEHLLTRPGEVRVQFAVPQRTAGQRAHHSSHCPIRQQLVARALGQEGVVPAAFQLAALAGGHGAS